MNTPSWTVALDGMKFLECPRWRDGKLYVADFYLNAVFSLTPDGQRNKVVEVPNRPGGIGWLPDGSMLVVSQNDKRILRFDTVGQTHEHADLSALAAGPLNDMVVSADGVAYVGNFGFDVLGGGSFQPAPVIAVFGDGGAEIVTDPLAFPNGSVITDDGTTLIVAETMNNRLSAFDIKSDGRLGPRRTWASFGPEISASELPDIIAQAVVGADGIALDRTGTVWIADAYHNRVLQVSEGGTILTELSTGEDAPFAVEVGGDDGRTVYACVAPNFYEHERRATELGRLLSLPISERQHSTTCP